MSIDTAAQLATSLERRILEGDLPPGARLDPVRRAADELGLAPNTVAAAYRMLADRGLVSGQGRRGTFVEDRPATVGQLIAEVPDGLVDLASGRPDPRLLPDLHPVLAGLGGSTATYGDPSLDPELEEAAVAHLASDGIPTDHLAVTGGAVDGVERALATRLRPGDAVAIEDPGWFATAALIRAMGLVPVYVAIDQDGIRPDALESVLGRVAALVVTPRAQNPTGAVTSADRAHQIGAILGGRPEVLVVEDDHMGPVAGAGLHSLTPFAQRWVHVRSFSKSLGPDLRVAVVSGDALTVDRLVTRQLAGPGWVSHINQRVTARLLESTETTRLLEEATGAYLHRRRLLTAALEMHEVGATANSGLNAWVAVSDEENAVESAARAGYAIRSGRRFRRNAPAAVRITVSEIDRQAADGIARALTRPLSSTRRRTV